MSNNIHWNDLQRQIMEREEYQRLEFERRRLQKSHSEYTATLGLNGAAGNSYGIVAPQKPQPAPKKADYRLLLCPLT